MRKEKYSTVVIGAGQAGLAAGYFLSKINEDFIIIERKIRLVIHGDRDGILLDSLLHHNMMVYQDFLFQKIEVHSQQRKKWLIIF